ncbi:hypothetical protein FSP39_003339 [Pinctada imbricata]|uniref:Peptidase M28 domain-containing protein n=1 Tax=Pinctada imbricata TaxID=66713 RepID=A0AA88XEI3_PINIB|nr:hypothetical protein FSP39_003339 [Pinctada imbricata]
MAWINTAIKSHFSQNRHHVTNPQNKAAAMAYIKTYMEDTLHLDVYFDVFPTLVSSVYGRNIIGVLKGQKYGTADDILYGIGAHYDTMRDTAGVDDNGSGVIIMLDAATSLAKNKNRKYTCFFVAFDFEEWEYRSQASNVACDESTGIGCGSKHFVYDWIPNFIANHHSAAPTFGGVYVMDTIMNFNDGDGVQTLPHGFSLPFPKQYESIQSDGFDGDFVAAIGRRDDHTLQDLFQKSWSPKVFPAAEVEGLSLPITGVPTVQEESLFGDFFRSDHLHFWRHNMSAIFLTDTGDDVVLMICTMISVVLGLRTM